MGFDHYIMGCQDEISELDFERAYRLDPGINIYNTLAEF